jgi:hypothetical protein
VGGAPCQRDRSLRSATESWDSSTKGRRRLGSQLFLRAELDEHQGCAELAACSRGADTNTSAMITALVEKASELPRE